MGEQEQTFETGRFPQLGDPRFKGQVQASRFGPYFAIGLPLPAMRPIPGVPERTEGSTTHARWHRDDDCVWFVSLGRRRAVLGLHGRIDLVRGPTGVAVNARFFPPLTPLLALGLMLAIGSVRGELLFTLPIAALATVGIGWIHHRAAAEAADEIRAALVQG